MKVKQKPVVAVLMGAILVLSGGVAFAATESSGGSSHLVSQMPAPKWSSATISVPPTTAGPGPATTTPSTAPTAPAPTSAAPGAPSVQPPISYTVQPGDNLSTIAAWFKLHGYQALYQANMAVIGANPDLIFPGQTITIANGTLTMAAG